ncbi:ABC transporter permease [Emticicia sp. BO119]|uniref:ABC transporter permease n=1 Tax=Emticicia sp. BO119 TaxID=2757768 RepID=UPI0015F0419D|nr:ABC transporter permease [Emticicia sp. BO119]MBA4850863.1 ABC transporter permease [Emticicia sp. BO119]
MLKNYLKISWRNLMKRKFYTMVTIFGLSVGITFALLIGSYVWGELSVNSKLRNLDNQYMIQSKWNKENMGGEITTLGPIGKALKANYPALVENYHRFDAVTTIVSKGDRVFREDLQLTDSTMLTMYGFPLIQGNPKTALNEPNTMVISTDQAIKYFGKTDVVGQTLRIESFSGEKRDFMITGVLGDIPYNSVTNLVTPNHKLPVLISFNNAQFLGRNGYDFWNNAYIVNYIELKKGIRKEDLEKPMKQLIATNASKEISDNLHAYLKPLKEVYLEANNGLVKKTILTLSLVALFILLMAVVNFVNISIGNSSSRLKEIGVRKVLGSMKGQVLRQFLTESVIISLFSLLVSLLFYQFFRPFFSQILQKDIASLFSASTYFYLGAIGLSLFIGILGGLYPSFVLANLPLVDSMKGKLKTVKENIFFRRVLLASQFTVALFVFGGATVISQQVNYFFTEDLGYNKESVFSVRVPRDWSLRGVEKMETVRNEIAKLKEIKNGSLAWEIPDGATGFSSAIYRLGQDSTKAFYAPTLITDEKFAQTYEIPIVAGQYFQAQQGTYQPERMVLNEAAIKALGFKNAQEAIGQQIRLHYFPRPFTIVGATKDFHFESMHKAIGPTAFMQVKDNPFYRYLSFRLNSANLREAMKNIEKKWYELLPDAPFEYTFMDETLQKLYQSEVQLKQAAEVATTLAIVIVLSGILGMVSLSIVRRTKEVGIRKVLGASGISIVFLFLKEFLIVGALAILIAFPLAVLSMNSWLQNYAYRVELSWITFAFVGFVFVMMVALLVGFQTLKAARLNPVKSLKIE